MLYIGKRSSQSGVVVGIAHDGRYEPDYTLNPRYDLKNYLYEWKTGYDYDFGPAFSPGHLQLALALMAFHGHDDEQALKLHVKFAARFLVKFHDKWKINHDVMDVLFAKLGAVVGEPRTYLQKQPSPLGCARRHVERRRDDSGDKLV